MRSDRFAGALSCCLMPRILRSLTGYPKPPELCRPPACQRYCARKSWPHPPAVHPQTRRRAACGDSSRTLRNELCRTLAVLRCAPQTLRPYTANTAHLVRIEIPQRYTPLPKTFPASRRFLQFVAPCRIFPSSATSADAPRRSNAANVALNPQKDTPRSQNVLRIFRKVRDSNRSRPALNHAHARLAPQTPSSAWKRSTPRERRDRSRPPLKCPLV